MKIARDNAVARCIGATADDRAWLRRVLHYDTKQSRFTRELVLLDPLDDSFPAGLLPGVFTAAARDGVYFDYLDERLPALAPRPLPWPTWLDPIQREALDAVIARGRGIVQMPTGAGKTELIVAMFGVIWPNAPALVLAPRAQLAQQARERWHLRAREGHVPEERLGLVADDESTFGRVTFGTFQAFHRRHEAGDRAVCAAIAAARGVIGDECHTLAAATFYPVLMAMGAARVRIGFSATPLARTDERAVLTIGALGPVIYHVSAPELVESGRIVQPTITMHTCQQFDHEPEPDAADLDLEAEDDFDVSLIRDRTGPAARYQRIYQELVVESPVRNALVVQLTAAAEKPALVFVQKLEHGKRLTKLLAGAGLRVRVVTGSKSTGERERAVKELRRGDLDVIVATAVFEAGVDIPELRSVVNAGAGASPIRTVQVLGRVLRSAEGKHGAAMLDVFDQGVDSLARHARARRRAFEEAGFRVEVVP